MERAFAAEQQLLRGLSQLAGDTASPLQAAEERACEGLHGGAGSEQTDFTPGFRLLPGYLGSRRAGGGGD